MPKQERLSREVTKRTEQALYNISEKFGVTSDVSFAYHRDDAGKIIGMDVNVKAAKHISQKFPIVNKWPPNKILRNVVSILEDLAAT